MQNSSPSPDYIFRLNRYLLSSVGLWSQQQRIFKVCIFSIAVFFLISQGYLQIGGMVAARCNPPIFMESLPPVLIDFMCYAKFINFLYNSNKMTMLFDGLKNDFYTNTNEIERKILCEWAKDSRKNTIMYAVAVYGSMIPFMLGPLVPFVIKLLPDDMRSSDTNLTVVRPLMFHVEHLIDVDKYYYPLLIHSYFGTMAYITVVVAIDTIFMVYVQHACALFGTIGYRLEHLVNDNNMNIDLNPNINNDKPYQRIIDCIIKHIKTLQYAQLIESAYSTSFLFQLVINMICISFTGFQAATKLDHPDQAVRYAGFTIAQTFHLFFESWPSQRLADESGRINEYITRSTWYLTSFRSRKLLHLLLTRSSEPCLLTAGSFYILNLQNFGSVVKSSMSYFTVLCSMQ